MQNGDTIENAIIIDAPNTILGIIEEHKHIDCIVGNNGKCIKSFEQNLIKQDGKVYDMFVLKMNDGTEGIIYFDITSFYGKI